MNNIWGQLNGNTKLDNGISVDKVIFSFISKEFIKQVVLCTRGKFEKLLIKIQSNNKIEEPPLHVLTN